MEEKEVLVKVEGLSKKFCKDLKTSLWYGVSDLYSNLLGNKNERTLRKQEFWAVKDINFELRRGECLGLIGHNGAGKSTLLKILNGLIKPDAGKVTLQGRVGALIELGAGFNPILTGRENIFNNGAVLGFSKKEIVSNLEEIIDFAEIRDFIDMPVQNYSSGMKVRLGFAVAAQLKPDVLLIDEVLAVGDMGFVLKCFRTIDNISPHTAIVFVSHNMPMVSRICDKTILLEKGMVNYMGSDVSKGIDLYYSRFGSSSQRTLLDDGTLELKVAEIRTARHKNGLAILNWNDNLHLYFRFKVCKSITTYFFNVIIFDKEQRPVAAFETNGPNVLRKQDGELRFTLRHNKLQLSKGIYTLNVIVYELPGKKPLLRINSVLSFQVIHDQDVWQPFLLSSTYENE